MVIVRQNRLKKEFRTLFNKELNQKKLIGNLEKEGKSWNQMLKLIKLCQILDITLEDLIKYYNLPKPSSISRSSSCRKLLGTDKMKLSNKKDTKKIELKETKTESECFSNHPES